MVVLGGRVCVICDDVVLVSGSYPSIRSLSRPLRAPGPTPFSLVGGKQGRPSSWVLNTDRLVVNLFSVDGETCGTVVTGDAATPTAAHR